MTKMGIETIPIKKVYAFQGSETSVPEDLKKTRWNVEKRLEFIDFRLYWDGRVNRSDLVDFFGVSVPQASADLSRYQESAPDNLIYDKSAKTYIAGPGYRPAFFQPSADGYLAQLRLLSSGILAEEQTSVLQPPEFSVVPILRRKLEPDILRRVLQAVRDHLSLEVKYQSISRPEPIWRWISPHALGFDGFRWHVRAWCHEHNDFRDFVIARVLAVKGSRKAEFNPLSDRGWHQQVTLKIGPNPRIQGGAREAIELDYGMVNGVVELTTRACLSTYVERFLGLDLDPSVVASDRQQIVLLNRDEVDAVRVGAVC